MRRLHVFEFGDQAWLPETVRHALTAYLAAVYPRTPFPALWAERLVPLLSADGPNEILDLGSGAGGPMPLILRELRQRGFAVHASLTDLHPNPGRLPRQEARLSYCPEPVDATSMPNLAGVRTMFAVFHHFRPDAAHRVLKNAYEQRQPICVFEATSRTPAAIASALLIPLLVLLFTPSVRPLRAAQVLLTYVLPVLPLISFWDGLVSHLRTYSVDELLRMTSDLRSPDYTWEVGEISVRRLPGGLPYLLGRPAGERA